MDALLQTAQDNNQTAPSTSTSGEFNDDKLKLQAHTEDDLVRSDTIIAPDLRSLIPRIHVSRNIDFQQRNTVLRLQPLELVPAPAPRSYRGLKYAKKTSAIRLL